MKTIKLSVCFWILSLFVSCSTSVPETFTYVLPNPPMVETQSKDGPMVRIDGITVADYVDQRGLVIEQGQNRIVVTQNRRWGESLDEGILRYLNRSLATSSGNIRLDFGDSKKHRDAYRLEFQFDAFQALKFEKVKVSGQWMLLDKAGEDRIIEKVFHIEKNTHGETYEAVIDALARSLDALTHQVVDALNETIVLEGLENT